MTVSYLVIIMGTQNYDESEYALTDLMQMIGRANKSVIDEKGNAAVLMCYAPHKHFYKRFLLEPLTVESHLGQHLHDHFNPEIISGMIDSKQAAVDYLTWSYYYRRLPFNPNYYALRGNNPKYI